jgi:hypothetical protein
VNSDLVVLESAWWYCSRTDNRVACGLRAGEVLRVACDAGGQRSPVRYVVFFI